MKQNKVAELLDLSESFVNCRINAILHKLFIEKINYGEFSSERLLTEAEYKIYFATGKTDSVDGDKIFLFLNSAFIHLLLREVCFDSSNDKAKIYFDLLFYEYL